MNRSEYQRTAGHPPAGVPLSAGYNPDATPTPRIPGFGGDVSRVKADIHAAQVGKTMEQEQAHHQRRIGSKA